MTDEIFFDGKKFIPAKEASRISKLTRDYIARLCREGKVSGKIVGKTWYVSEHSLRAFLHAAEKQQAQKREDLRVQRMEEYRSAHESKLENKNSANAPLPVGNSAELPQVPARSSHVQAMPLVVERMIAAGEGAQRIGTDAARQAAGHAVLHAGPLTELGQRATALFLSFVIVFGTYASVDAHFARFAQESIQSGARAVVGMPQRVASAFNTSHQHSVASAGAAFLQDPASAAEGWFGNAGQYFQHLARTIHSNVDAFVLSVMYAGNGTRVSLEGDAAAHVSVNIEPYTQPVPREASSAQVVQPRPQTIVQQPVIERIVERERVVHSSGVSETLLNERLEQLDNRLSSLIYEVSASVPSFTGPPNTTPATVRTVALTNRIDQLSGVDISGGTITGASISGGSLSGVTLQTGDLSGVVGIANGGTGTSTAPSYGQVLLGNADGSYSLVATSSLGITSGSGTFVGLTDTPDALATGDILYASAADTLAALAAGTDGQVLKLSGGVPVWSTDIAGSGGAGLFATTSDSLAVRTVDPTDVLILGSNATSTTGNILEVVGDTLMRGALVAYETITGYDVVTAPNFTATSTSATSTLPNLALTNLLFGSDYVTDITGTGLTLSGSSLGVDDTAFLSLSNYFASTSPEHITSLPNLSITESQISDLDHYTDADTANYINASTTIWNSNTESSLESFLADVTNVFTNNDGSLDDDDLSDNNIADLADVSSLTNDTILARVAGSVVSTSTISDFLISDALTISSSGSVNDAALSADVSLLGQTIAANELASADFGDFTCNGTTCSFDADTVSDSEIDYTNVTLADFTNDAGFSTFSYLFPSNATSTLLSFTGGLLSTASTTIGGGTAATGLTVDGTATTSKLVIPQVSDTEGIAISGFDDENTSTFDLFVSGLGYGTLQSSNILEFNAAGLARQLRLASNGAIFNFNNGAAFDFNVRGDNDSNLIFADAGADRVAIGTSSPYAKLSVWGDASGNIFEAVTSASSSALVVDETGFVSIGTSTLLATLAVIGADGVDNGATNAPTALYVKGGNGGTSVVVPGSGGGIQFIGGDGSTGTLGGSGGSVSIFGGTGGNGSSIDGTGGEVRISGGDGPTEGNVILGVLSSGQAVGNIGIGTSSPFAKLTVWGDAAGNIFEVVTSASSTALAVSGTGFGTTTVTGLNINGSATTTANVGFNITDGCFAVNGTCVGGVSGGSTFSYLFPSNATSTLLSFTGGLLSAASTTIGDGTQAGGLTISGGATTTGELVVQGTATSTFAGGLNISSDGFVYNHSADEVYIGALAPTLASTFFIQGDAGKSIATFSKTDSNANISIQALGANIDPTIQFWLDAGSAFTVGVDDADDDAFKISAGGVIGTNDLLTITSATSTIATGLETDVLNITSTSATSTFANGIQLTGGCFLDSSGNCLGSGSIDGTGAANRIAYFSDADTLTSSANFIFDGTNLGVGTSTPYSKLTVWSDSASSGNAFEVANSASTTLFSIANSTSGTSTIATNISITGNLVPSVDDMYSLGLATHQWKDVFIGPGSLYVNGKKVIEDVSDTITFSTDDDQNLMIETGGVGSVTARATGSGNTSLATDSGNININSTSGNINLGTTGSGQLNLGTIDTGVWNGTAIDVSDYTNLTVSATGLELSADALALTTGYTIPLTASTTEWATAYGWGDHSAAGYATFSYLFPSNATSTPLSFTGGLLSTASTTIGNGTQAGGLTVAGGATTTGTLIVQGTATSTFAGGLQTTALNITSTTATSTFANGIQLTGGCFLDSAGNCLGSGSIDGTGAANRVAYFSDADTLTTDTGFIFDGTNLGVGTSTPYAVLSVSGAAGQASTSPLFAVASSTGLVGGDYFSVSGRGFTDIRGRAIDPEFVAEEQGTTPGTTLDSPQSVFVQGNYAYVTNIGRDSLAVIDISSPNDPVFVAEEQGTTPGTTLDGAWSVFVSGNYAYVANANRDSLAVIDISNPANPVFVAEERGPTPGTTLDAPSSVFVQGNYAYMANSFRDSLAVIDISNPADPVFVAEEQNSTTLNSPQSVFVQGSYAYVANKSRSSLAIIDISNPNDPVFVAEEQNSTALFGASSVFVSGNYAYVANSSRNSLAVIDISNPADPVFVAEEQNSTTLNEAMSVFVSGNYAYVANNGRHSLAVIDISNPADPVFMAEEQNISTLGGALSVFVSGNYAYVASRDSDSLAVIDIGGAEVSNLAAGTGRFGNLSVDSFAQFSQGANVAGALNVGTNALISGALTVTGNASSTIASGGDFTALSVLEGNVAIGTSSPYAKLSVWGDASGNIFEAVTSASSTALAISATGFGTTTVTGLNINGSATSTSNVGWNLTGGCFAVNGTCVGGGGSSLFTDGGSATYLTSTSDFLGIGTTSPYSKLTVWGGSSGRLFETVSSASTTLFSIDADSLGGVVFNTARATTTVPNNDPYAWTIATSTTGEPLFRIDTTSGAESLSIGALGGDVYIGAVGSASNLIFEESSTIHGQGTNTLTFGMSGDTILFPVGLLSTASTTVGDGTQAGGLTISGGATTTGELVVQGTATSTFAGGLQTTALNITSTSATSTFANGIQLTGGCFLDAAGNCLGSGSIDGTGVSTRIAYFSDTDTLTSNSAFTFDGTSLTAPVFNASGASTTVLSVIGESLIKASTTDFSLFIGFGAGATSADTNGLVNLGVGGSALTANTTGQQNVAIGHLALDANTEGNFNTAVGIGALGSNTESGSNTAVGYNALGLNTGLNNIALGYNAGDNLTTGGGNIIIGTDIDFPSATASSQLNIGNLIFGTGIDGTGTTVSSGNIGIGTTSPFRKLSITDAVATAQTAIAYDATRWTDLLTNSVGDFVIDPQGDDVFLNSDNLWVCTGGSCPAGSPTGTGNLIVENKLGIGTTSPDQLLQVHGDAGSIKLSHNTNTSYNTILAYESTTLLGSIQFIGTNFATANRQNDIEIDSRNSGDIVLQNINDGNVGIGTTTPTEQLSVENQLYVGAGGATGMGTATSTFQGDIRITGKLDVGTIDPVYTIDGVKYATYGHSTIGVKEEVVAKIEVSEFVAERGLYRHTIQFDSLEEGSDLWLFYQVTDMGERWENLVVTLTPAFDGRVFYEEDAATNTLTIYADKQGAVSMRLIADRYDADLWPNLRPDQDDDFTHHVLESR